MANDLTLARNHALALSRTLMVPVSVFQTELGYAVLPSDEFDGDQASLIVEFDPFG